MLTEGEIVSVDEEAGTCRVRIPLFESLGEGIQTILTAHIAILPGAFNKYKVGDLVWLGFERNKADIPVIIGKMYQGAAAERKNITGGFVCNYFTAEDKADLPNNTTFSVIKSADIDYNSYNKLILQIKKALLKSQQNYNYVINAKLLQPMADTTDYLYNYAKFYNGATGEAITDKDFINGFIQGTAANLENLLFAETAYTSNTRPGFLVKQNNNRLTFSVCTINNYYRASYFSTQLISKLKNSGYTDPAKTWPIFLQNCASKDIFEDQRPVYNGEYNIIKFALNAISYNYCFTGKNYFSSIYIQDDKIYSDISVSFTRAENPVSSTYPNAIRVGLPFQLEIEKISCFDNNIL